MRLCFESRRLFRGDPPPWTLMCCNHNKGGHVCRKLSEQQSVERPSDSSIASAIIHKPRDHAVCNAVACGDRRYLSIFVTDEVSQFFD
jgi:hypothetical protein